MPQHADTDVHNGLTATLCQRRSRKSSQEQLHYKAKKIEQHKTRHKTQCSEQGSTRADLGGLSAQTNQAYVSNRIHKPASIKPQESDSTCDSTYQSVRRMPPSQMPIPQLVKCLFHNWSNAYSTTGQTPIP